MARTADPRTRPALLQAAGELFYSRGIGATSVDDVAAASGLTKPTLYRHFPSKESLLAAYLAGRHDQLDAELRSWIEASPPRQRPRAVVDWLCDWLTRPGFNGCAFVRTYAELQGDEEVRARAKRRKLSLLLAIEDACRMAGASAPGEVAAQLALIVEGATTMAFVSGGSRLAAEAGRTLADLVLAQAGLAQNDA
jgi:AcrR family transcriptional regulator